MSLTRSLRLRFAMLLTLLLPLQGYAAMPVCDSGAAAAITHVAAVPAMGHDCAGTETVHHHSCNQCCCGAAIALTPGSFIAPHFAVSEIAAAVIAPSPEGALDRLDRPPRFILA